MFYSGVREKSRKMIIETVETLGGLDFTSGVKFNTTHCITTQNSRTKMVLKALAMGAWILSVDYVKQSASRAKWVRIAVTSVFLKKYFSSCRKVRLNFPNMHRGKSVCQPIRRFFIPFRSAFPTLRGRPKIFCRKLLKFAAVAFATRRPPTL